jgi:hypothetical protein
MIILTVGIHSSHQALQAANGGMSTSKQSQLLPSTTSEFIDHTYPTF